MIPFPIYQMAIVLRIFVFFFGLLLVAGTIFSAVETFILPRSAPDPLTRTVFRIVRWIFQLRMVGVKGYYQRDRIMAFYAPVSLLALLPTWYFAVMLGYAGMYWALGATNFLHAMRISGSSLLTLGYSSGDHFIFTLLEFSQATLGLMLVALLISYLPSMYAAFSRREAAVSLLEVRAGNPPDAIEMLTRYHRIHGLEELADQWTAWENWFSEIQESHTSLAALVFFRSPDANHSWITAAGAVMDAAALSQSVLATPSNARASLCIRAGYLALRSIADFFKISYPPDPRFPETQISLTRSDFETALDKLAAAGLPLQKDRDQAWQDFAGWRVNYDHTLLGLAELIMAPPAPWSGSRSYE